MKTHAIIPIFIPHMGCPNDCIFCNQKKITAHTAGVTAAEVRSTIDTWLSTITKQNLETVEVAFYGGSFTGIPLKLQCEYLSIAKEYKDKGLIDKIHMSTRPDYINDKILDNLEKYEVDTIELGVQSFDNDVLMQSRRGHSSDIVYKSADLIKKRGFELGIQLMIGLPGDTMEKCIYSAKETVKLAPSLARLYPTIVLDDTDLLEMYKRGEYTPLSQEEAVNRTKEMYKILDDAGITIMRVGLKSTDIINENGAVNGGTYHPAFRQLVEGRISRERIENLLKGYKSDIDSENINFYKNNSRDNTSHTIDTREHKRKRIDVFSNPTWFSNMKGHKCENALYFEKVYPELNIKYRIDPELTPGQFRTEEVKWTNRKKD